jgi:DNA-binding CsgD family transcriptional regulator
MENVGLMNRGDERQAMDGLLDAVSAGLSSSLVLRGEPGIGKTALLDYAVSRASGMQVARVVAIESEMELSFAALYQLLVPFLARLDRLPGPQRDALGSAFGLTAAGPGPPDQFLVGLATLTLLSAVASQRPLLVVVDDAQWLDNVSAEVLAFVARRVFADRIAVVFAVREPAGKRLPLDGLTELHLTGLPDEDARALLTSAAESRLDSGIAARLIAETRGNPLALIELPGELTDSHLAGGLSLPEPLPVGSLLQRRFLRQVRALPADTQALLLLAAADTSGDPALLWRAAERRGLAIDAAAPAEAERLLTLLPTVSFRHPLIRSAVYHGSSVSQRRQAHQVLAAASDPQRDPDRRAWHLAEASVGPDEHIAAELEQSAARASQRGGYATTAAFLARAAELTPDASRRATRCLAAAQANLVAGMPGQALALVQQAEPSLPGPLERAMAQRLRGTVRMALGQGHGTLPVILGAARALMPLDVRLGRDTLLEAMEAALFFRRSGSVEEPAEVALAASAATPVPGSGPAAADLLLDGFAARFISGYQAAVPHFRRAIAALRADMDVRWFVLGCLAAGELWDLDAWHALASRWVALARERGALTTLPIAMSLLAGAETMAGRLSAVAALAAESAEVSAATGNPGLMGTETRGDVLLWAMRGAEAETRAGVAAAERELLERGLGGGSTVGDYALTLLDVGLGNFEAALPHALRVYDDDFYFGCFVMPDVVECAARTGNRDIAAATLDRLARRAGASGTPWALGVLARSQALVAENDAERLYLQAISHLNESVARPDLSRAHLLYGEWLRRQRRGADARTQLRTAHDMFGAMGLNAFATRARTGLRAMGDRLSAAGQKRPAGRLPDTLTAQEERIARLVAEGASNSEAAAQLFLSPSTVDYHLRKVFRKLGLTSRTQLVRALGDLAEG